MSGKPGASAGREPKCPICGKPAQSEHEPFCSKRCAQVDLHRWLSGRYVIPGRQVADDDPDAEH